MVTLDVVPDVAGVSVLVALAETGVSLAGFRRLCTAVGGKRQGAGGGSNAAAGPGPVRPHGRGRVGRADLRKGPANDVDPDFFAEVKFEDETGACTTVVPETLPLTCPSNTGRCSPCGAITWAVAVPRRVPNNDDDVDLMVPNPANKKAHQTVLGGCPACRNTRVAVLVIVRRRSRVHHD